MWIDSASKLAPMLNHLVASGGAHRGLATLAPPHFMVEAAQKLHRAKKVALCTGFYIPSSGVAETDGPIGSAALARACKALGAAVTLVTDSLCEQIVAEAARSFGVPLTVMSSAHELRDWGADVLCFIERPGRAADGRAWSMRHHSLPESFVFFDDLLPPHERNPEVLSIAIGDGGNECGMGRWKEEMTAGHAAIAPSLALSEADWPLTADVSDWGAWALAALLSGQGLWCGLEVEELEEALRTIVAAGAVDGTTGRGTPSIDGYDLSVCSDLLKRINDLCRPLVHQTF